MTAEEREYAALEAERLLKDPTLRTALASIRMEALERLASIPATRTDAIQEAQSIVRVSDGFLEILKAMIVQGQSREGPAVA